MVPAPLPPPQPSLSERAAAFLRLNGALLVIVGLLAITGGLLVAVASGERETLTATELPPPTVPTDALGATEGTPTTAPRLAVYASPHAATVELDGVEHGQAPLRLTDLEPRAYRVRVAAPGYLPTDTLVDLAANPDGLVVVDLAVGEPPAARIEPAQPEAPAAAAAAPPRAPPAPARSGTLAVRAFPWGTISVDGVVRARESDLRHELDVPAGARRVRVEHPTFGVRELTVTVGPDQRAPLDVRFDEQP